MSAAGPGVAGEGAGTSRARAEGEVPTAITAASGARAEGAVALVLVSHSARLAEGLVEVAGQMAPGVDLVPAGGTDDGRVGTSFDRVLAAVEPRAQAPGVVVLADLGSAVLTAESALDVLDDEARAHVRLVDGPFVEGVVAAAVEAAGGGSLDAVARAAVGAGGIAASHASGPTSTLPALTAAVTLRNRLGLHARPAARLARLAAGFEAVVEVDGVAATGVLELMGLGVTAGHELHLRATGRQAAAALAAVVSEVEAGFGEE